MHHAGPADCGPNPAARIYSSGGRALAGVPGKSFRPSLRKASQSSSTSTVRGDKGMMNVRHVPLSVRAEALDILARLGVQKTAFSGRGLAARSPITGELIAHLPETAREEASAAIGRA